MEAKGRLSFDDAGSVSALRRFTRSPTHRLSLRRLTPSSSSSSAASVTSADSSDGHPSSCASRDTSRDECALHRFIVWVAVKRNACPKMTAEEKRECPLLRCRKRFPNHELMLQHLYACDRLFEGEYWCYDCEKVERLHDEKCRRCMGHPSKRRKIMTMAKNLFSSLGHKSRDGSIPDLDLDVDSARPSFDCVLDPNQAELQATEIHEIGSSDVPLPTILETAEPETEPPGRMRPPSTRRPVPLAPVPINPAELESRSSGALLDWEAYQSVQTVAPENLMKRTQTQSPDRPVLQLHTHGLEQYLQQAKRRSKMLAPSSSVRSTSSTTSTNSTSSAASYAISPISSWSGAWTRAPGFDSTLTSPADDLMSPGGLLPNGSSFVDACKFPGDCGDDDLNNSGSDSFLSELPADIPMLDAMPMSDALNGVLGMNQSALSFDPAMAGDLSIESNLALTDNANMPPDASTVIAAPSGRDLVTAHNLVGSARDALEMHIDESMAKVQHVSKNHLVTQFRNMSPSAVAQAGLATLTDVLEGRQATSPVDLLCFVHVVYSFSLVVHEQDAPSRWADLFSQAMSYSSWFSRQDLKAYTHVVAALWKPSGMSDDEVKTLLRAKASQSTSVLGNAKGKQPENTVVGAEADSLVFVAQYFLDELEYQALQETSRAEVQASELSVQHLKDVNLEAHKDSPFALAVNFLLKLLAQQYGDMAGFAGSMRHLSDRVNSSHVSTARRVELELMHAGRTYLPADVYYDEYIVRVRRHMDSLYSQNEAHFNPRSTYYRHGVALIQDIMKMSDGDTGAHTEQHTDLAGDGPSIDALDEFIQTMTPDMDSFDFGSVPVYDANGNMEAPVSIPNITVDPTSLDATHWMLTPEGSASIGGPSVAATTSPSPAPNEATANKVESNSSCEICGYRPKGDPRWFGGSMAKHKKLQHATSPPKIYRCPYPGCKSQYRNRPDNLRQHQIEKGHFVEGEGEATRRPSKRKKMEE